MRVNLIVSCNISRGLEGGAETRDAAGQAAADLGELAALVGKHCEHYLQDFQRAAVNPTLAAQLQTYSKVSYQPVIDTEGDAIRAIGFFTYSVDFQVEHWIDETALEDLTDADIDYDLHDDDGVKLPDDPHAESVWPAPGYSASNWSLSFDATAGHFLDTIASLDWGIVNGLTVLGWVKHSTGAPGPGTVLAMGNSDLSENRVYLQDDLSTAKWTALIYSQWNNATKLYRFGTVVDGAWQCVAYTWNGISLRCFVDGIEDLSPAKIVDLAVEIRPQDVRGDIGSIGTEAGGSFFHGLIHQIGMWSTALSPAAILALYNAGNGNAVDPRQYGGAYTPAYRAAFVHWWKPGLPTGKNRGQDFAQSDTYVGINRDHVIDDSDRILDVPDGS